MLSTYKLVLAAESTTFKKFTNAICFTVNGFKHVIRSMIMALLCPNMLK